MEHETNTTTEQPAADAGQGESTHCNPATGAHAGTHASDRHTAGEPTPAADTPASQRRAAGGLTLRERVLAAVAAVAVVTAVVSLVLYNTACVPPQAAAKVNSSYINEEDVAAWLAQYRAANSVSDDTDFASYLRSESLTVSDLRQDAVNELALNLLVTARAEELGVTPTDEQAQEQADAAKESYAFGDDEVWAQTLEQFNLTEEQLLEQYKVNLAQDAVCAADVPEHEATDDDILAYTQSYLADTTQKHVYRIVCSGDDAEQRAQECYEKLQALKTVNAKKFAKLARTYSDEADVEETGGSYAWSGSSMDDAVKNLLDGLEVGQYSEVTEGDDEGTYLIVYCDEDYTFPAADELEEMPDNMPDGLAEAVAEATADALWRIDCNAYLAALLANAAVTYYPVPADAAYNVDMALAYE